MKYLSCFLVIFFNLAQGELTVLGEARVEEEADQFILYLGVVSEGKTVEEGLLENTIKMDNIYHTVKNLGFEPHEIETSRYAIQPVYSDPQKETKGYEVHHHLIIRSSQLDLLGKLIESIAKEGVNRIDQIQFASSHPDILREKALQQATTQALRNGKTVAEAAGLLLKRVTKGTVHTTSLSFPQGERTLFYSTPQIERGMVSSFASVSLTFEIERG